jgi:predicted GNAT superfamily acetyltransferase
MIVIRKLKTVEEFKETAEIQKSAWGITDLEVDPHFLMTRVQKFGGLVHGLFLENKFVGFTYGILGKWRNEIFFFSYMAAVRSEYQSQGLGFLLKKAQRAEVIKMGYKIIRWNFDPLESLNAYFNFHRLGVICSEYERNVYGKGESGLDEGLPTDRLLVTWNLISERVSKRIEEKIRKIKISIPTSNLGQFNENIAYIEIPRDIRLLKKINLREANKWRKKTRNQFETAFSAGYVAKEIIFSEDEQRIFYKLIKKAM